MSYLRPDATCAECGQARPHKVLNARGVCPWCTLSAILVSPNPAFRPVRKVRQ